METTDTGIYEFGDFRVDAGRRLLLGADGRPLPLAPKAFDTLLYLVRHTDGVLGKETLMRAIWADTAVEENNLNQCISALRRALGEKRNQRPCTPQHRALLRRQRALVDQTTQQLRPRPPKDPLDQVAE